MNSAHALASSNPLIADYIKHDSRGMATALVGVSSSLGALIGIKFIFGELKELDYSQSTKIVSLINFIVALFLLIGIKDLHNINKKAIHNEHTHL
jgi:VIT1/CCC1 family predicted Fe2+/Mn2+ transporter